MDGCLARTITKIEANPLLVRGKSDFRMMRVAAYCRVSTDDDDQLNSYQAQIAYYTDAIAKRPNSTFAGIYADEGITGTSTKKRKDFLRLMRDCERGKVDYILTKSISRFARNTVDSLSWVRKLRAMGIGVYFEEQAIDSLKAENETLIGLFSVIAQSESENIAANVRWGIRQSMKSGTYCTNFSCFGYRRGDDGVPVIVPEEAEVVRTIFKLFLDGKSIQMICRYLAENKIKTYTGKTEWNQRTVRDIITNEKYVGDLLLQKTYIEDTITKKTKKNNGEFAKYLISNNHPAIVDRDTFNMAQAELASRTNKRKKSELGITEQGKYSGKYALTDVLICGCCGSHYRRTGKNVKGEVQHVWRCLGRIEHRCKEAVGLEEKKLHAAIWENGLGLPNPESMAALEKLFDIVAEELATKEPESIIVKKNRKLRWIGKFVGWSTILVLLIAMSYLPVAIHKGEYGFTTDMAAGSYADEAYIDTGDYRIYYFTFGGDFDDGRHWSDLQGFKPVKKHFWGCTVSEDDYAYKVFTKDNYVVGRLYTIKGEGGYYNLIDKAGIYKAEDLGMPAIWNIPGELITATTITISGVEYELQDGFFFITNEPVRYFEIGEEWYDVE